MSPHRIQMRMGISGLIGSLVGVAWERGHLLAVGLLAVWLGLLIYAERNG